MKKYLPQNILSFILSAFIMISSFVYKIQGENNPYKANVIIAQSEDEHKLFFPDVVTLPDGKILVAFYKNTVHAPDSASEPFGTLCLTESTDNGETWSKPIEIMSSEKLVQLGICTAEFSVEARDPNLTLLNDGTVLLTFFTRRYDADTDIKTYMMESKDGGKTWGTPAVIPSTILDLWCAKRGNIAVIDNEEILVPLYGGTSTLPSKTISTVIRGTRTQDGWNWSNEIVLAVSDDDNTYNEVSLVTTDGCTVYALAREPGTVFQSKDRGLTWQIIDSESKLHQPGFAIIDENRIFATWSRPGSPRPIYGKMFFPNEGWSATKAKRIYALPSKITGSVDMGDPSCTKTADGKIFVVYYQTMDKIIGGTYVDSKEWEIQNN